jgi:hypothetical protein
MHAIKPGKIEGRLVIHHSKFDSRSSLVIGAGTTGCDAIQEARLAVNAAAIHGGLAFNSTRDDRSSMRTLERGTPEQEAKQPPLIRRRAFSVRRFLRHGRDQHRTGRDPASIHACWFSVACPAALIMFRAPRAALDNRNFTKSRQRFARRTPDGAGWPCASRGGCPGRMRSLHSGPIP